MVIFKSGKGVFKMNTHKFKFLHNLTPTFNKNLEILTSSEIVRSNPAVVQTMLQNF